MDTVVDAVSQARVSDVMNRRVVRLNQMDTMATAARLFAEHQISGGPVCNDFDHCVGVLSVNNFAHDGRNPKQGPLFDELVGHHMSSPVVSVLPDARLSEAALIMCQKHTHRLPVINSDGLLVGMISSLDIVAALIQNQANDG